MESCTATVSPEEFRTVFQLSQAPEDIQTAWISSLSANPEVIDANELKNLSNTKYLSDKKRSERGPRALETDCASPEERKA